MEDYRADVQDPPSQERDRDRSGLPSILRRESEAGYHYNDENQDDEYLSYRLSDIFHPERVNPILRTTAEFNGLDGIDEDEEDPAALRFGSLNYAGRRVSPVMKVPVEVGKLTQITVKAKKTYAKPPVAFDRAFRVSENEHDKFFSVPTVDEKVELIMQQISTHTKINAYSKFWESELFTMDRFMRSITRLSAFQLSILNATMVELQPLEGQDIDNSVFAIPASDLATDIAGQMMKLSIGFSHRLTRLRRQNMCVGLKTKVIDILADDLLNVPYDVDPKLLFGGQYDQTEKKAAKKQKSTNETKRYASSVSKNPDSYGASRRNNRNQRQYSHQSSYRGASNNRGYKRKFESQAPQSSYTPQAKRGPGRNPGRGRGRGGRGSRRGGRQSRL
jgi:hypothetical protein